MRVYKNIRDIDKDTTEHYASIRAELFRRYAPRNAKNRAKQVRPERLMDKTTGQFLGIQENDLWIAAIAAEYKMVLVTDDRMARIQEVAPNLSIVPWKRPPTSRSASPRLPGI